MGETRARRRETERQAAFVRYLLADPSMNATEAAIQAGYGGPKKSRTAAGRIAHDLLRRPDIAAQIDAAKAERSERTKIDADWLLRRLAEDVDADIADLYDDAGNIKKPKDWPDAWRKGLIAGIETLGTADGAIVTKIKLADRTRIKELIGKHTDVGAFVEKHEHSGPGGKPIEHKFQTVEQFEAAARKIASEI
ncbi:phage terminase small subunit [Novosphingobium capsulatum]|uniref:Phage terminase small subunit n=1 Tax=Novosphingobium capsulatum TaxID=13688 RepID=A0ABU1MNH6_9SPHN|nr:terminase small subunit [Novosphingobium capsulatum]MDR6511477.1 phage terminase small subunit [Novosphingobium capsulatum]